MALKFCDSYLSNSVLLSSLPFPCNHGNLTLKLYKIFLKNSYLNERWHWFKVGSLPRMINKEVFAQFIYKPTEFTEKLFSLPWKTLHSN